MPLRETKIKNEDGSYVLDDQGNHVIEHEKFCKHFIADTQEEANDLMKKFEKDILMLATKRGVLTGVDVDDLKQEGLIGLARARRDFDDERSVDFRIFALYKIKDAMRELITKEAANIRIPQYIKDAIRLTDVLAKLLGKVDNAAEYMSYLDLWNLSKNIEIESPEIRKDMEDIKSSLRNLADRSHSTVPQLLERAEIMPTVSTETADYITIESSSVFEEENRFIDMLSNKEVISHLFSILDKHEIDLLWKRYVEGVTLRELEPKMGVKAETLSVRTQNILDKLRRHGNRSFQNEINSITKDNQQGQPS